MLQILKLVERTFCNNAKSIRVLINRNYGTKNPEWKETIFSGIQPTGTLHFGNYYGAVQNWVDLQAQNKDVILSIVDLHSITLPQDPKELNSSILKMTASLLACGIDPERCILFQQSKVPEHALLGWVLGTMTTMVRLYHFPQYKEKSAALKDVPLGLFIYPVLQAADILLYKATHVPVGDDQLQHLHLAQHLVHAFNNKYGVTFPLPQTFNLGENVGGKIRSLREPEKKMSKSHADPKSRLEITDSPDVIVSKVKKAVTDFTSEVTFDLVNRPGVSNLIILHSLATGKSFDEICREAAGLDTGKYKLLVADALVEKFAPIRRRLVDLLNDPHYLNEILNKGAEKAQIIADKTWSEVRYRIGFDKKNVLKMKSKKVVSQTS